MTDDKKDRLIVEALGVSYVKKFGRSIAIIQNSNPEFIPNLATPEGFFWTWKRAQKMEWWLEFICVSSSANFLAISSLSKYLIKFINPTCFRDALAEFLEKNKK